MQASLADARGQAAGAASAEAPPAAEREANEEERALQEVGALLLIVTVFLHSCF